MNREAILFHLKEAKEELDRMIGEIEQDRGYSAGKFVVNLAHLYHHVNTAWNGRNASAQRHRDCRQRDFDAWRKFPKDREMKFMLS